MRGRVYCCDGTSRTQYDDYYSQQAGGSMPVFVGKRYQKGHGLGSILGGIFSRYVVPFAKDLGKQALGKVLETGAQVASDVASGQKFKDSIKTRSLDAVKKSLAGAMSQFTGDNRTASATKTAPTAGTGVGRKRKKKAKAKPTTRSKTKARKKHNDIFG